MGKIIVLVVIVYNNAPTITYRGAAKNVEDCYTQALILAKNAPDDEHVEKYMIGCSFEDPLPSSPT